MHSKDDFTLHPSRRAMGAIFLLLTIAGTSVPQPAPRLGASGVYWPSFRGPFASGVAAGQALPDHWDGTGGENIRWKIPVPGLAHSSPIVWEDRVYATSAISSRPDATFKHGLFGEGDASDDRSMQQWKVFCFDRKTGAILWQRVAFQGVPREKRHIKSTYANSTPATDGKHLVAFFGSQGLYGYDMQGNLLWSRDLGFLNAGAYDAPEYEWGNASSPILFEGQVIVQCDTQGEDFLLALDAGTGKTIWKTARQELPSWSTPTVFLRPGGAEIVTNAPNFIRGYDARTGKERWRLGGSSKITAPTPVASDELIVVASGRRPEAPLFVIRGGVSGDISLRAGETANSHVAWSRQQRGPYMPTPLIYQGLLYVLANQGIFDCYDLQSGNEVYRKRIPHQGGGFSSSPVAADGRIYLSSEDGDMFVVKSGAGFELLATNPMGERLMATPAISGGMMYVRGEHRLFAIGR